MLLKSDLTSDQVAAMKELEWASIRLHGVAKKCESMGLDVFLVCNVTRKTDGETVDVLLPRHDRGPEDRETPDLRWVEIPPSPSIRPSFSEAMGVN